MTGIINPLKMLLNSIINISFPNNTIEYNELPLAINEVVFKDKDAYPCIVSY